MLNLIYIEMGGNRVGKKTKNIALSRFEIYDLSVLKILFVGLAKFFHENAFLDLKHFLMNW